MGSGRSPPSSRCRPRSEGWGGGEGASGGFGEPGGFGVGRGSRVGAVPCPWQWPRSLQVARRLQTQLGGRRSIPIPRAGGGGYIFFFGWGTRLTLFLPSQGRCRMGRGRSGAASEPWCGRGVRGAGLGSGRVDGEGSAAPGPGCPTRAPCPSDPGEWLWGMWGGTRGHYTVLLGWGSSHRASLSLQGRQQPSRDACPAASPAP